MDMMQDAKRQKLQVSPKPFMTDGNTSLGSLPRGDVVVRRDTITLTSAVQAKDFKVGAPTRTKQIPRSVLEAGIRRIAAQDNTMLKRQENPAANITARQASVTPDALSADGVTANAVNTSGQPIPQTRGPGTENTFTSARGLTNPTNRTI